MIGAALDLLSMPGEYTRGAIGSLLGQGTFGQRLSSQDLTGWNDPDSYLDDIANYALDVGTDPLSYLGGGGLWAGGKTLASRAAARAGIAERAAAFADPAVLSRGPARSANPLVNALNDVDRGIVRHGMPMNRPVPGQIAIDTSMPVAGGSVPDVGLSPGLASYVESGMPMAPIAGTGRQGSRLLSQTAMDEAEWMAKRAKGAPQAPLAQADALGPYAKSNQAFGPRTLEDRTPDYMLGNSGPSLSQGNPSMSLVDDAIAQSDLESQIEKYLAQDFGHVYGQVAGTIAQEFPGIRPDDLARRARARYIQAVQQSHPGNAAVMNKAASLLDDDRALQRIMSYAGQMQQGRP